MDLKTKRTFVSCDLLGNLGKRGVCRDYGNVTYWTYFPSWTRSKLDPGRSPDDGFNRPRESLNYQPGVRQVGTVQKVRRIHYGNYHEISY